MKQCLGSKLQSAGTSFPTSRKTALHGSENRPTRGGKLPPSKIKNKKKRKICLPFGKDWTLPGSRFASPEASFFVKSTQAHAGIVLASNVCVRTGRSTDHLSGSTLRPPPIFLCPMLTAETVNASFRKNILHFALAFSKRMCIIELSDAYCIC